MWVCGFEKRVWVDGREKLVPREERMGRGKQFVITRFALLLCACGEICYVLVVERASRCCREMVVRYVGLVYEFYREYISISIMDP